jgi:hypothetical protein
VLSQPWPNGLRLHLCDIMLEELAKVGGGSVDTDLFLTLLSPFFTLLSTCPDRPVFQRTLDRIVLDLVRRKACEDGEDDMDTEEGEATGKNFFPLVDLTAVQARIFDLASAPETKERYAPHPLLTLGIHAPLD